MFFWKIYFFKNQNFFLKIIFLHLYSEASTKTRAFAGANDPVFAGVPLLDPSWWGEVAQYEGPALPTGYAGQRLMS